jgi:MFS family permease
MPAAAPLLTRSFGLLMVGHFLQALGYSSMLLLPLYLDHLGASRATVGVVMGAGAIGGLVSRPAVGWALDSFGRKPTLVVGTVTLAFGTMLVAFVTSLGPFVYLQRVIFGVGQGALFTAYFTFAADIIPEARRTEGIALFGVSGLVPLLVNPFASQVGVAAADLRWFLPLVGLVIGASLLVIRPLPEPPRHAVHERLSAAGVLRSLRSVRLLPVWFATIVFSGLVATFMAFATIAAEARGLSTPTIMWVGYPLAAASVRLVGARLPDRVGPHNIVAPALLSYGLAMVTLANADTTLGFLLAGLLGGLGHGYCFPVLVAQVVDRVPAQHRGSGLAMFTALWGVAELALAPAFGAFADAHGDRPMFALASVVALLAVSTWAVMEHRLGRP